MAWNFAAVVEEGTATRIRCYFLKRAVVGLEA
jgi:hypothetical protein